MKLKAILLATALSVPGTALAGIADTKHNLGSAGPGNTVSDTSEICVFCHTPHGASTDVNAPLWNKAIDTTTSYQGYSSTTMDGEVAGVGNVSMACLSCHDGTQAMDNIINAPGSGGLDPTGGGDNGLAWSWSGAGVDPVTGVLISGAALIGVDLRNDHPIGVQYGGGGITSTAPDAATKDEDFNAPESSSIGGITSWWVESGESTDGVRNKNDMILYTRTDFAGGTQEPSVECASCHDPHTSDNATFLRIANGESKVCLACHIK